MDRDAALGDLLERYVFDRWQEDLLAIGDRYDKNQIKIETGFVQAIDNICRQAAQLQAQQLKGDIQYIYVSLLRTSVMEHRAHYRIDIYDERWFLDPVECSGLWEADFIFDPLFQRITELNTVKTQYARKISSMDIERILQIEAARYHLFAIEFMRNLIPSILEGEGYILMGKKPNICLLVGEYRDQCEILHGNPEGESSGTEAGAI